MHFLSADPFHTALDDLDHVGIGALQSDGDNTMHLLNKLVIANTLSSQLDQKLATGDSVIWSGPGMLIVSRINSLRVVWLSCIIVILITSGGCILLALAKETLTTKHLFQLGLVVVLSMLYSGLGTLTGLGLSVLLGLFLALGNPYSFCSNYLEICLMAASCCLVGSSLFSFFLEETVWQLKKRGKISQLLPLDMQMCCLTGVTILYNLFFVLLLAADFRFSSVFIYPSLAGPFCVALQICSKILFTRITKLKLLQLKWYGRIFKSVVCQWIPFITLLAFPFFFGFPTIIFVLSAMGPQMANSPVSGNLILCTIVTLLFMASVQIFMPYTHGGATLTWGTTSYHFANFESYKASPETITRIQGSRSTGLWVVSVFFGVLAFCLFIAAMILPAYSEYNHLKYYSSLVNKPADNETYIVVVPASGESIFGDYLDSVGYIQANCPQFWTTVSKTVSCYPAIQPAVPASESLTYEDIYNTNTSTREIKLNINGTRFPWVTMYFDQDIFGNIAFDGIPTLDITLQANEPLQYYSGNPNPHNHTVLITLPYHTSSLIINVLCQCQQVDQQLRLLTVAAPPWSIMWGPDYQPTLTHLFASLPPPNITAPTK
ncbi:hypothetical protein Pelo_16991 [Pelomyxa schiedti]|nr:hypothetical protein Pelo_16991 [Pelomyxa schiedti]